MLINVSLFSFFVVLLQAEAGVDPLSWGLFGYALIIFLYVLAAQSLSEIPCGWASSKRFCSLRAVKSILKLANCTVKRWLMALVCGFRKKKVHCTTEFKWISLMWGLLLYWEEKIRLKTNKQKWSNFAIPLVLYWTYIVILFDFTMVGFLVNVFLMILFFSWFIFGWLFVITHLHISRVSYFLFLRLYHSLFTNVTPSTEDTVPTLDCVTLLYSSEVGLLKWGGNSALNPVCSLWQHYLLTAVRHCILGMPNALSNKHLARVSFASSPFWHKYGCGHPPPFSLVTRTKM